MNGGVLALLLGCFTLAVEGGFAVAHLHSWGRIHHRLGDDSSDFAEAKAVGGSAVVAVLVTAVLLWTATSQGAFHISPDAPLLERLADTAQWSLACLAQNMPEAHTAFGTYCLLALRLVWVAYISVLLFLVGWLVEPGGTRRPTA